MKKRISILMALPAMLLVSCGSRGSSSKSSSSSSSESGVPVLTNDEVSAKELNVYFLDGIEEKASVESGAQGKATAHFIKGEEYIPYFTLRQYASMYDANFAEGAESSVVGGLFEQDWIVKYQGQYALIAEIDPINEQIFVSGSLDSAYQGDAKVDTKALTAYMSSNYQLVDAGANNFNYSYAEKGIKTFKYENEYYFPLALLDLAISDCSGMYFYYNYAGLYLTKDVDHYSDKHFTVNGQEHTVDSQMAASVTETEMPQYLKEFNANCFMFLMDNMYGLKDYHNIESMKEYYKQNNIYDNLLSSSGAVRAQAYADALDIFDDNHTALVSANNAWGEGRYITRRLSKGIASRRALHSRLEAIRTSSYESYFGNSEVKPGDEILYSSDGKTAMYMFDEFAFAPEDVFDGDDEAALYAADTFLNLVHIFNTIKAKGGVENIVLDISTNGGGVVGVMMKLLSLLSKNNSSVIYYFDGESSQIISGHCSVDSNKDEKFNSEDSYGNDFNFYILTSDCSFSCANAFPCTAQALGIAKIIGQKSGGGECAVAIHYLPNSQYVYHSSNLHLGYYNSLTKKFTGFEGGAKPDIEIEKEEDFYDVDNLNNLIANAK